jgi:hypothetical protein
LVCGFGDYFGCIYSFFKIGVDQYPMSGMLVHDRVGFSFAFHHFIDLDDGVPVLPYDTSGFE